MLIVIFIKNTSAMAPLFIFLAKSTIAGSRMNDSSFWQVCRISFRRTTRVASTSSFDLYKKKTIKLGSGEEGYEERENEKMMCMSQDKKRYFNQQTIT